MVDTSAPRPWPDTKCEGCEVAPGRLCYCQVRQAAGLCQKVSEGDLYFRQFVLERSEVLDAEVKRLRTVQSIRPWDPSGPIRLGLATPGLVNIGGTEKWLLDLLRATSDPPFHWEGVVSSATEGALPVLLEQIGEYAPVTFGPDAIREMAKKVDVLIAWGIIDLHDLIGPDAGCRTVHVSHNLAENGWTVATLRDAPRATACIAVAKAACRTYPATDRSRCRVVYNTASLKPPTLTREAQRQAWGVPDGKKVVGFLGRLCYQKYAEGFVEAIAALPPEWVGVMVGSTPDYVEPIVRQLGVGGRIIRPGLTEHPENALNAFDVLLMPSRYEAHSIALTEAWLAGVPVVSTVISFTEEYPHLIRAVPHEATGGRLAAAVLADAADVHGTAARVEMAREFARTHLSFDRFRIAWREALANVVGPYAAEVECRADGREWNGAPVISEAPGFLRKALNFGTAAVQHAAGGFRTVSAEVAAGRMAICELCPLFVHAIQGCQKCGCNMPLKTTWAEQGCPEGKWLPVPPADESGSRDNIVTRMRNLMKRLLFLLLLAPAVAFGQTPPSSVTFPAPDGSTLTITITPAAPKPVPPPPDPQPDTPPDPKPVDPPPPPPPPTPAPAGQRYSHIRLALIGYGDQLANPADAKILNESVDLVIGGEPYYERAKDALAQVPAVIYVNLTQLNTSYQADWIAWATANGVDIEAAFYHTASPPSGVNRLISQYNRPPDVRPATNPSNPDFRRWCLDYCRRRLAAAPRASGLFIDNSAREFAKNATAVEPITQFAADYGSLLSEISKLAPVVVQNTDITAEVDPLVQGCPLVFWENRLRALGTTANDINTFANAIAHFRSIAPGFKVVLDTMPNQISPDGKSSPVLPSDPRLQIATLANYYLLADPSSTYLCVFGGYAPNTSWATGHWWPAIAFDVGAPTGPMTVLAAGADPTATDLIPLTYKVFSRQYAKALVLYKPVSFSGYKHPVTAQPIATPYGPLDDSGATEHDLGGTFRPLNPDGTLGNAMTRIRLRNGEGAILIPAQ